MEECPDYVPRVETFLSALSDAPLPAPTQALVMEYYERIGALDKAEDALCAMLEAEPDNALIIEFGIAFYERLQVQSDAALAAGNLPRSELETSLAKLRHQMASLPPA